ncbi:Uncharacterised protein [Achromobacter denitrificans]|nr:hypothetical protein LMG1231_03219 [Achromobacter denitrificans]SUU14981.1 Uncharacterised protein [Achromobacter denitrificans]
MLRRYARQLSVRHLYLHSVSPHSVQESFG